MCISHLTCNFRRSYRAIIIISEIDDKIILNSWERAGLVGDASEIHVSDDDELESEVDLDGLCLTDDRTTENQVQIEEINTKKMKQKSILDFFKS